VTALCFLLGGLLAVALGAAVWAGHGWVAETKSAAKSEVGSTHFESALELVHFELEQTKKAYDAMDKLAHGLETTLAEYLNAAPNADLAGDDVRNRVLRLSREWADATRAAHAPGTDADAGVSPGTSADAPPADLSSPDGVRGV
jgi:hypothetical protein